MARDQLVRASIAVHGTYNNGRGGDNRPLYIHRVLESASEVPKPVNAAELTGRLTVARAAITEPPSKDVKKALRQQFGKQLEFEGRWGYEGMRQVADLALKGTGLSEYTIASIARSELDAEWVLSAEPASMITDHASLILAARGLVGYYHNLDMWEDNSD